MSELRSISIAGQGIRNGSLLPPWRSTGKWEFDGSDAVPTEYAALVLDLDERQRRLQLEFEVLVDGLEAIVADIGSYRFRLATESGQASAILGNFGYLVAQGLRPRLALGTWQKVRMAFGPDGMALQVAGREVLQGSDPNLPRSVSGANINGEPGMRVRNVVVRGEPAPVAQRSKRGRRDGFSVAMTVDPCDDYLYAERPWVEEDFRGLVATLHEWGIDRIYWIYNGDMRFGRWQDSTPYFNARSQRMEKMYQHVAETFENVRSPLSVVADEARKRGMTAYAIVKPYDYGRGIPTLPDDLSRLRRVRPGLTPYWRIGGYCESKIPFLMDHPELLMRRHPYGTDPALHGKVIRKIKIYSHSDAPFPFAGSEVSLLVSEDNAEYHSYSGPIRTDVCVEERPEVIYHWTGNRNGPRTTRARVLTLRDLAINDKYFAVAFPSARPGPLLANRVCALAGIFTNGDEPVPFTLGLEAKPGLRLGARRRSAYAKGPLEETGANFEMIYGFPMFSADRFGMNSWWVINAGNSFLAFCRGKSPNTCVLSYAHKESRDFVLSFVEDALKTGVDGVTLRLNSHSDTFEQQAYGFDAPAVAEFRRRYGVDVLTEDFDWFDWQKLRGEYLTQLVREVSSLVRGRGKKCQAQVGYDCTAGERQMAYMNLCHDWQTWLREGMVDEVTHKEGVLDSPHWHQVRRLCGELGLPFHECRVHGWRRANEGWAEKEGRHAQAAFDFGMDGVILYENASALRLGDSPGTFNVTSPGIVEVIRSLKREKGD